jgi:hypothetical protein
MAMRKNGQRTIANIWLCPKMGSPDEKMAILDVFNHAKGCEDLAKAAGLSEKEEKMSRWWTWEEV